MSFDVLKMVVREKREIPVKPVLLKFGVALAISLGGILYTILRNQGTKPPKSKPSQGNENQADARGGNGDLRRDDRGLRDLSLHGASSQNPVSDLSPSGRYSGDRDYFLLPEFDEIVKECNMDVRTNDPRRDEESPALKTESARECKYDAELDEHNKEIRSLRNKVKMLEERERNMEIQLLEYYGLKEQETAVIELKNRLRLNNMEAKLYNLRIESLQSDNRRLQAQVAEYAKVVTELEAAKAKIKLLKKKLRSEAEQNREQILILQQRVMKLQEQEKKALEKIEQDVVLQQQKKEELKEELEEMKKTNQGLKKENSDLARKLEYVQMVATSALDNEEVRELKEETQLLRQQNEDLAKEIERLQADRCSDVEELVYLRWINACLRYELRNYQPGPDKTIARDLSKTLSPKSEERAKQLILEYASKEGGERGMIIDDFDSDQMSTSQASNLTDYGELDPSLVDNISVNRPNRSSKNKLFSKLMRLLRGKGQGHHHHHIKTPASPLERAAYVDATPRRYSCDSLDVGTNALIKSLRSSSGDSSRHSFDLHSTYSRSQKSIKEESSNCSRRTSDDGSLRIFRTADSQTEDDNGWSPGIQVYEDSPNAANVELVKYAEALKNSM